MAPARSATSKLAACAALLAVGAVGAVGAVSASGCALSADGAGSGTGPGGKADGTDGPLVPTLAPAYEARVTSRIVTTDLEGHEPQIFESRIDGLLIPVVGEDGVALELSACRVTLPQIDGRQPTVPDETVRMAGPVTLAATFTETAEGELTLATETGTLLLGVDLEDPVDDALPVDGDDPRVIDQDDDDDPGVTVRISGFSIYLGARAKMWLAGVVDQESGVIAGDADLTIDAQIYGDSIPFVDARERAEAAAADESRMVSETINRFELIPREEAVSTCAFVDG